MTKCLTLLNCCRLMGCPFCLCSSPRRKASKEDRTCCQADNRISEKSVRQAGFSGLAPTLILLIRRWCGRAWACSHGKGRQGEGHHKGRADWDHFRWLNCVSTTALTLRNKTCRQQLFQVMVELSG